MGLRGPIQVPDSRRGLQENGGKPAEIPAPERLTPPAWVSRRKKVLEIFAELTERAEAAGVPTKSVDAEMFGVASQYTLDFRNAKTPELRARIGRDMEKLYDVLGLHVKGRLRMGIRVNKPGQSKTAKLLSMIGSAAPKQA